MPARGLLATVAIPTFNGEQYLRRVLEAVTDQRIDGAFDVLVIDSGSSDATLDIVRGFPEVRLHEIPNEEFGHGRTRNLAARLSQGEYTAYLTHDAIPLSDTWLSRILQPMRDDPSVAGVFGKQVPRPDCFPLQKYDIQSVFSSQGPDSRVTVQDPATNSGDEELAHAGFYSDVNSAARTSVLTDRVPYRDVPYAEDQLFGRDILVAGYRKAYAPDAAVEHSNDLTLRDYGRRLYDETVGLRIAGLNPARVSFGGVVFRALRRSLADGVKILRDPDLSFPSTVYWLTANPFYEWRKWSAVWRGGRVDLDNPSVMRDSLEARLRSSARPSDDPR